jgi:hypothetical protein
MTSGYGSTVARHVIAAGFGFRTSQAVTARMVATVEIEVQLIGGERFHPDTVTFMDSGWLVCYFSDNKHYFPPHRVKEVNKVQQIDDSSSTDA